MKKILFLSLILSICAIDLIYAQNDNQKKLLIIGGLPLYDLSPVFESSCSRQALLETGCKVVKDIITAVNENMSKQSLQNVTILKIDSSFNIEPLPFNNVNIYLWGMGAFSTSPAEFYMFGKDGERLCEFQYYLYSKTPKILKNCKPNVSYFSSSCDYLLVIWPLWWFHARTETNTVNENWTYWMVAYGLYSTKTGEFTYTDYYWTKDKGKKIEYPDMVNKIGENLTKQVVKNLKN